MFTESTRKMPDSYYDMLSKSLVYCHKQRPSAGELLKHKFVIFSQELENEKQEEAANTATSTNTMSSSLPMRGSLHRSASIRLTGSKLRHGLAFSFEIRAQHYNHHERQA
jgi:serine/threonine protein kinase